MSTNDPPCLGVCIVDPASGSCLGCGKTAAELSLAPAEEESRANIADTAEPVSDPQAGDTPDA